jgi:hypothetical protein
MEEREYPRIMPGVDVFDADEHKLGTVAHVYERGPTAAPGTVPTMAPTTGTAAGMAAGAEGAFELKTGFFGLGKHYFVPFTAIKDVTTGGIFITARKNDLDTMGWDTKPDFVEHPEQMEAPVSPARPAEVMQPAASTAMPSSGMAATSAMNWGSVGPHYRARWTERYGTGAAQWETYEPRYRFAWEQSQRSEFRDRSWISAQPELRNHWETLHPDQEWDTVADTVRDAWEHPPAMAGMAGTANTAAATTTSGTSSEGQSPRPPMQS